MSKHLTSNPLAKRISMVECAGGKSKPRLEITFATIEDMHAASDFIRAAHEPETALDDHSELLKKLPNVHPDLVAELEKLSKWALVRRVLIQADWLGSYSKCLDGLDLRVGVDGCWNPRDIRAAVEKLRAAEPPNVWQPIETAPKLGKWVLLWWPAITDAAFVGYCVDGVWKAATSGDKWPGLDGPTHWMPLPAGPAVTKDAGECGACDKPGEHCANVHGICSRHGGRPHETEATQVTTYEVGETSGVCKHCGLSWLLHIAEDDRGRKNVCAPIQRAESESDAQ